MVDATARLYDVDEDLVVFRKLDQTARYDQGTITFRARKGKLVDLAKLHESIWATRLSGGTRSGLVTLNVTAVGELVQTENGMVLKVANSKKGFALGKHTDKKFAATYGQLTATKPNMTVRVTGLIDNYRGRWPSLLKQQPKQPRRILVTNFDVVEKP